jgi:carbonic anhydrase
LAAILIYVGYKLTKPVIYKEMFRQGASRFIPFIVTVVAIIATDLLTGIIVGLLTAFFFILKDNSHAQIDIINEIYPSGDTMRLVLPQHMSFLTKASLISELESIPDGSRLIIDARTTQYIDRDIMDVLDVFKTVQAPEKEISINMLGFKDYYEIHDQIEFLNVTTYYTQTVLTPEKVLEILKEGNNRFILDKPINRHIPQELKATSYTQHPIAIIVGCIDSRVPVESIFDMGFGDVFVSRVAGNVINDDILGSLEFACHSAGAKLIVVLGHTFCGAIKAACDNGGEGHVKHLLDKIRPAIEAENETKDDRTSDNAEFMMNVTKLNVENSLKEISSKSNILNRMIEKGEVGLVGATYDIRTGIVHFTK